MVQVLSMQLERFRRVFTRADDVVERAMARAAAIWQAKLQGLGPVLALVAVFGAGYVFEDAIANLDYLPLFALSCSFLMTFVFPVFTVIAMMRSGDMRVTYRAAIGAALAIGIGMFAGFTPQLHIFWAFGGMTMAYLLAGEVIHRCDVLGAKVYVLAGLTLLVGVFVIAAGEYFRQKNIGYFNLAFVCFGTSYIVMRDAVES